jgi:4-hydroxybenzoate polyprenyltransferase
VARPLDAYEAATWAMVGLAGLACPVVAFSMLSRGIVVAALGLLIAAAGFWVEGFALVRGYHSRPTQLIARLAMSIGVLLFLLTQHLL